MLIQNRGKNVAIGGAILQLAFTVVMLVVWLKTSSLSAMACTWILAGGLPLWLLAAVLFYARLLERREALELEDLAAGGGTGAIFRQGEAEMRPAAARVAFLERWVTPIFTFLWAGYHVAMGVVVLRYVAARQPGELSATGAGTLFSVLIAFIGFLFSSYNLGMSRRQEWRLLRATGSYLLVNTLLIAAVAASLLAANQGRGAVDRVAAYVLPAIQLVLAAELLLNLLLDLYRPRLPGAEARPSFDSRLFNLISQPGRVGHSIAEAVNYQFGFEVSRTWFYRLLSRAMVPLLIFGAAVLIAVSSLVIVHEGQQAVILHWGKLDMQRGPLGPGLHVKLPWPVQTARTFDVDRVQEVVLGLGEERHADVVKGRQMLLWTEEHGEHEERNFLIAAPRLEAVAAMREAPPVDAIKLAVSVRYVVDDVAKYALNYVQPKQMLEAVAYREMVRYCATATLDEPIAGGSAERPEAIVTFGRTRAARELKARIEKAIGPAGLDLGVKIIYLGIETAHPPAEAAPAFEEVFQAERQRDGQFYDAQAKAAELLGKNGNPDTALQLAFAIRWLDAMEKLQELAGRPEQFQARLRDYLDDGQKNLRMLGMEIERQRLLGQLQAGRKTVQQELAESQGRHLATLRAIQEQAGAPVGLGELIGQAGAEANRLFDRVSGSPAVQVAKAQAARWKTDLSERARAEAFHSELEAYRANPRLYKLDRWLSMLEQVLPGARKYVLSLDQERWQLWLNMEEKAASLEEPFKPADEGGRK